MKRIVVLLLAVIMIMSIMSFMTAGAADLENGIAGKWTEADTPAENLGTQIIIKKELVSYNQTSTSVFAPAFSYIYTVTPADEGETVTDEDVDHLVGVPVTAPVKAGITEGLVVTGSAAGAAGDEESAVGTLAFTNSTSLTTSTSGGSNMYDITLDFSGVTFTEPGVYRYKIEETLADGATYDGIAINDGGSNVRYLDVYVDGAPKIYGYVCMKDNESVDPTNESDYKTNGFVASSEGQDEYYTYDLAIAKKVVGDEYAKANHAFPFTVIFNNSESYTTTYTITETAEAESVGFTPAAASAPTWSGVVMARDGKAITYTGIPAGVDVDVYETNDVLGVTYTVETTVTGGATAIEVVDDSVAWGDKPTSAVAQGEKPADYESTKVTVDSKKIDSNNKYQIDIINTLLLISPTGVVVRVAPYVMILAAGIALLLIGRRRRHTAKD